MPVVAPYVDMLLWPTPDLAAMARASGVAEYTLGFLVSTGGCDVGWGGRTGAIGDAVATRVAALRDAGGDAILAFGGAAGVDVALRCPSAAALADVFAAVAARTDVWRFDFDVEGAALADRAAGLRRAVAIADVQARARAAGRRLGVSFTLPVLPDGLGADALGLLQDAVAAGVAIDVVNVMAMDYGDAAAPAPAGRMGAYAVAAATATWTQLGALWPGLEPAARWARVGVTPMVGRNDVATEVFTVDDARLVGAFARAQGLGRLAWWSASRDVPCPAGQGSSASPTCSGVPEPAWAFARAFTGR
jgi:hypothetical protein